jgi:hypothetical protein
MNKKFPIVIGGLLAAAALLGLVGATVAYAQDPTPPAPADVPGDGRGPRGGPWLREAELQAAADALGMTTDELTTGLQNGKTLEELAEAAGVDLQAVQDAISAAHAEEMRTWIDQAVTDGTISQDKADWLLKGLEKGFLDGPGFGFGMDPGPGFGGPGHPGEQPATDR